MGKFKVSNNAAFEWIVTSFVVLLFIAVMATAWAVRHVITTGGELLSEKQTQIFIALADLPRRIYYKAQEYRSTFTGDPIRLLKRKETVEQPSWERNFPAQTDSGYLLLSGVDPVMKHSVVRLLRVSDGKVLASWNPDWAFILPRSEGNKNTPVGDISAWQAFNPLLMNNGDIIFNTGSSLVRLSTCRSEPEWVLGKEMHHSNELDETGKALWIPSVSQDGIPDNPWLQQNIRDEALAHVSTEGKMLEVRSFARILINNDLEGLLLGNYGTAFNADPFRLNQIKVALNNSNYWHKGDLLISAGNLSTLFLYRPATDKIIWHQTGPWMNQNSVDFVDDHRISVFNNNVVLGVPAGHSFLKPEASNQVMVYDFDDKQVSEPFAELIANAKPRTIKGGRARLLPDGGLFVEETNNGRHLRFAADHLMWSRVNDYDAERIGLVSWSRYLTAEEVATPLKALSAKKCAALK